MNRLTVIEARPPRAVERSPRRQRPRAFSVRPTSRGSRAKSKGRSRVLAPDGRGRRGDECTELHNPYLDNRRCPRPPRPSSPSTNVTLMLSNICVPHVLLTRGCEWRKGVAHDGTQATTRVCCRSRFSLVRLRTRVKWAQPTQRALEIRIPLDGGSPSGIEKGGGGILRHRTHLYQVSGCRPINLRYSRSHAAGMLSRGEYGPGR